MLGQAPTAIGTFNFADSYRQAGSALRTLEWADSVSHARSPVEFLYWHAIELFLKAFLLACGMSETELRGRKYGHNLSNLVNEATNRGLALEADDSEVLSLMPTADDMIDLRYIKVGLRKAPKLEALETISNNLYRLVGLALRDKAICIGPHLNKIQAREA
jgi:hypothetical protein